MFIHVLQAFSDVIFSTAMQQLTSCDSIASCLYCSVDKYFTVCDVFNLYTIA